VLVSYEFSDFTEKAAAKALAGRFQSAASFHQHAGPYPFGHGLMRSAK